MIRYAAEKDFELLSKYDKHICETELKNCIKTKRILLIFHNDVFFGWLRYNLFWDNTPFLNMLYILEDYRKQGLGSLLLEHWENQMQIQGYETLMTSTLVHEDAIHFYMKYGYQVVGGFHPSEDEYEVILKK